MKLYKELGENRQDLRNKKNIITLVLFVFFFVWNRVGYNSKLLSWDGFASWDASYTPGTSYQENNENNLEITRVICKLAGYKVILILILNGVLH